MDVRLGGIYALEQIAKDSPDWHNPAWEVVAAFVQQHAIGTPLPEGPTITAQLEALEAMQYDERYVELRPDIAAALSAISRRDVEKDARLPDLKRSDFRRMHFPVGFDLRGVDLAEARFDGARMMYVRFNNSTLLGAQFVGADLEKADLSGASLWFADLSRADLAGTILEGARLQASKLSAVRNLTQEQLQKAELDEDTVLPDGIDRGTLTIKPPRRR